MHGLNKVQELYWDAPAVKEITDTSQYANTFEYFLADPTTLNDLGVITNGATTEVFMKRINFWIRWYNFSSFPVYIQATKFIMRRDVAATVNTTSFSVTSIMQDDAPLIHNAFISPTTSNAFQKQCKIIKMKTVLVPPGRSYICKMKRKVRRSIPWTGRVQGNASEFHCCKGDMGVVFRVWGYPGYSPSLDNMTELAHYRVHPLVYRYASFYRMDDAIPSSVTTSVLPSTGSTSQLRWYSNLLQQYDVPTATPYSTTAPKGLTEFPVQTNVT